jgi:DmsE family decaheme c-type cytochrome
MNLRSLCRRIAWNNAWWFAGGAWCLLGLACTAIDSRTLNLTPAGIPGATRTGNASCVECHEDQTKAFVHTVHGQMRGDTVHSCEACHGPASKHIATGGEAIVMPNDASCIACHASSHGASKVAGAKTLGTWMYSSHASAGVKCIDCHSGHSTAAKQVRQNSMFRVQNIDDTSAMCMSCHQEMYARISMPYHHPIREGAMGCTSCHDPHGNPARQLLSQNESCVKCHQAQQGPFSHEHQPVVENCSSCHDPHGSPNPKMTRMAQPMLCTQCHSLTLNRHRNILNNISPAALRDCTACHGVVHGSDIDAYMRH